MLSGGKSSLGTSGHISIAMFKILVPLLLLASFVQAQTLPAKWEELTAEDFVTAVARAGGVCVLPFGIVEKHGPSGPLGTDLINIRATVVKATEQEYAVIFPEYYAGQIFEARHGQIQEAL